MAVKLKNQITNVKHQVLIEERKSMLSTIQLKRRLSIRLTLLPVPRVAALPRPTAISKVIFLLAATKRFTMFLGRNTTAIPLSAQTIVSVGSAQSKKLNQMVGVNRKSRGACLSQG